MKQLMIDNQFLEHAPGCEFRMNKPEKMGPIIENTPAKFMHHAPYGTVMHHEGILKMWNDGVGGMRLYTSIDGIHWGFAGVTNFPKPSEGTVFKVDDAYDHELEYIYFQDKVGLFIVPLKDSLHADETPCLVARHECDTQNNMFWDRRINKWVVYLRGWVPHRDFPEIQERSYRSVIRLEFDDFSELKEIDSPIVDGRTQRAFYPQYTVMWPEQENEIDIYTNAVVQYQPDLYLAFPSIYKHLRYSADEEYDLLDVPNEGLVEIRFGHSRDGINWIFRDEPYVDLGIMGKDLDCCTSYMFVGMAETKNEIIQYYWSSALTHRKNTLYNAYDREYGHIHMVKQRKDGFAYITPTEGKGRIITKEFRGSGEVKLNIETTVSGWAKIKYKNDTWNKTIIGNFTDYIIPGYGDNIQLEIELKDAKLYSIEY